MVNKPVRTIPVIPDDERIRAEDIQALLTRASSDDAPVTRTKFARFLADPSGVVIPDDLLEIRAAPWGEGTPLLVAKRVLAVAPEAVCAFLTTNGAQTVVHLGANDVQLPKVEIPSAFRDTYEQYTARVLGFDGASPVILWTPQERERSLKGVAPPHPTAYAGPPTIVTKGSDCIIEEPLLMHHALWHPVVGVAYVRSRQDANALPTETHVCVNGRVVQHIGPAFVHAFGCAGDGSLIGAWGVRGDVAGGAVTAGPVRRFAFPRELHGFPRAIVPRGQGAVVIFEEETGYLPVFSAFDPDGTRLHERFGPYRYLGHYAETPDGRCACVGEWYDGESRRSGQWWVVNGVPGPRFTRVSTLFERNGSWCYYAQMGCDDARLMTMRLHTPSAHEEAVAAEGRG